jgi:hypothetical protein
MITRTPIVGFPFKRSLFNVSAYFVDNIFLNQLRKLLLFLSILEVKLLLF